MDLWDCPVCQAKQKPAEVCKRCSCYLLLLMKLRIESKKLVANHSVRMSKILDASVEIENVDTTYQQAETILPQDILHFQQMCAPSIYEQLPVDLVDSGHAQIQTASEALFPLEQPQELL